MSGVRKPYVVSDALWEKIEPLGAANNRRERLQGKAPVSAAGETYHAQIGEPASTAQRRHAAAQ